METGRVFYPIGKWIGIYFSEELKAVESYGYKFRLISGKEYERINDLFEAYVDHLF